MRRYLIAGLTLTILGLASSSPAVAQSYKGSAGWSAGGFYTTSLNNGATGSGDILDLKPDLTWTAGVHYDHWLGGGNIGIRAEGGFSRPILPWVDGDRKIRVFMADLDLMLRPAAPEPGRSVLPFFMGGVGLINWGLGDGPETTFDAAGVTYDGKEALDFTAVAGLGIDFITPWRWGEGPLIIRLEGRDHMQFSSPFDPANPEDAAFGLVHNGMVLLGLHTGIGVLMRGR